MLKLGIQLKEVGNTLNIQLLDPTKKQLSEATDNEKTTAQVIKEVLEHHLMDLISEHEDTKKED